jgi:hypothetical protein
MPPQEFHLASFAEAYAQEAFPVPGLAPLTSLANYTSCAAREDGRIAVASAVEPDLVGRSWIHGQKTAPAVTQLTRYTNPEDFHS